MNTESKSLVLLLKSSLKFRIRKIKFHEKSQISTSQKLVPAKKKQFPYGNLACVTTSIQVNNASGMYNLAMGNMQGEQFPFCPRGSLSSL